MKKLTLIITLSLVVGACATTTELNLRQDELQALARYNAERESAKQSGEAGSSSEPAARPVPFAGYPVPMGPPEFAARLNRPIPGCDGALMAELDNNTRQFAKILVDGTELVVTGAYGALPGYIPPGASAFVCLDQTGRHEISGVLYANRYGQLREVRRFSGVKYAGPSVDANRWNSWRVADLFW